MSDKTDNRIRRKALRAARAVTMSAALVAAGCASEEPGGPVDEGWTVTEEGDASADAEVDTRDTSPDVFTDAAPDAAPTCSQGFDQVCPNSCEMWNDADCCDQGGGWWDSGGCAVPGPFVPPSMPA